MHRTNLNSTSVNWTNAGPRRSRTLTFGTSRRRRRRRRRWVRRRPSRPRRRPRRRAVRPKRRRPASTAFCRRCGVTGRSTTPKRERCAQRTTRNLPKTLCLEWFYEVDQWLWLRRYRCSPDPKPSSRPHPTANGRRMRSTRLGWFFLVHLFRSCFLNLSTLVDNKMWSHLNSCLVLWWRDLRRSTAR